MGEITRWALECFYDPEGPTLDDLPTTYPWARLLAGVNTSVVYEALLPTMRGVLFTGPEGNGRHTQARAFANSQLTNMMRPGRVMQHVEIDAAQLSPRLSEQELAEHIQTLYRLADACIKENGFIIAFFFDQLDLYPQSMMDAIAACMEDMDPDRCITVCIAQDETCISRKLRQSFFHCRCLRPTREQRLSYLKGALAFHVQDSWSEVGETADKMMVIDFDGIDVGEIADLTEWFSYADLAALVQMMKLLVSNFTVDNLKHSICISVMLPRAEVLNAIELTSPAPAAEPRMAVGQPLAVQHFSTAATVSTNHPPIENVTQHSQPLQNDFDKGIELIIGI